MNPRNANRDPIQNRANKQFVAAERRDTAFKTEITRERTARDAKTARLRALRLARDAEMEEAEAKRAAEAPPTPKKPARKRQSAKKQS